MLNVSVRPVPTSATGSVRPPPVEPVSVTVCGIPPSSDHSNATPVKLPAVVAALVILTVIVFALVPVYVPLSVIVPPSVSVTVLVPPVNVALAGVDAAGLTTMSDTLK